MATAAEALGRAHTQFQVKLYIKNTSGSWVDFTSRLTSSDRLLGLEEIQHEAEGTHGQPLTRSLRLTMANQDRYWSKTPPAEFTPWEGRDVQVRLKVSEVASEINLATYRIAPDGIETDLSIRATVQLEPLTEKLARVDAAEIKQGQGWYQFRPWTFLVEELIRSEFGDTSGALPGSYEIPSDPRFTYPDGLKHVSVWGKPPQWDGTSWNQDNTDIPWCLDYDFTNNILYVGIGKDLWEFDPATDTWTNRGEDATIGAGVAVRRVFVIENATRDVLVLKWADSGSSPYASTLYQTYFKADTNAFDTSARKSWADFFSGTWWIFNGEQDIISSQRRLRGRFPIGQGGAHGNNIGLPFPQYITQNQSGGSGDIGTPVTTITGNLQGAESGTWYPLARQMPAIGNYRGLRGADNVNADLQVRIAFGNKPNVQCDVTPPGGIDVVLFFVYYSAGTWGIRYSDITRGGAPADTSPAAWSGRAQIHGYTLDVTGADPVHAWVEFTEGLGSANDTTEVYEFTVLAPVLVMSNANCEAASDLIIDVLYAAEGDDDFVVQVYRHARAGKFPQYQLLHWDDGTNTRTLIDSSIGYFQTSQRSKAALPIFYVDTQTGSIKKLTAFPATTALVDSGRPPVFDAPYAADISFGSGSDPEMWGLSFPFHSPETQASTPAGKYYLWNYGVKHSGRVELGYFEDLDKLAAVSQLCEAFRKTVYVDRDGDWVVKDHDPASAPIATIEKRHLNVNGWVDVDGMKSTEVVNYVSLSPTEARLGDMKTTIFQKEGSPFDGNVRGQQLDTQRRSVRMRCLAGGDISEGNTRWDVRTVHETITTRLGAAYSSGTSVTLESVWDVAVGDIFEVANSGQRTITVVNSVTRVITISSGLSSAYPILSPARITKPTSSQWSSAGVTTLTEALDNSETGIDVASADEISIGNYIIVDAEEMLVTDKSGLTLTVTRGDNAAAHSSGATVGMLVRFAGLGKWSKVGNQGIQAVFESNGTAETSISTGDYVEFVCPGLRLEEVQQSLIIATDDDSIRDQGKRELRSRRENRFLTPTLAEYWAKDLVAKRKRKKRRYGVAMPLGTDYFLADVLNFKSVEILPSDASNTIASIARGVKYSLRGSGRTVYQLEER